MASRKKNSVPHKSRYTAGSKLSKGTQKEGAKGAHEFLFCPEGEAVYFKKSWHHVQMLPAVKGVGRRRVKFALCPAHRMQRESLFEGEVVVKNVPRDVRDKLFRLIRNVGDTAYRMDVLDRILELGIENDSLRVTTSENQLAKKIAKKIKSVFKKAKVEYIFSKGGDFDAVRVRIDLNLTR